ncbi:transcriptional regulatory protein PdtaR [Clostridium aceticum]|uniref:Stage 0 sporulation protein A homolog n=1 Tax=Clostridium aceticum TaxID=84022 RepID=A0A0D8I767_9CLOT|nr:response regulator [Clostridium aceticum]AKL93836.1 transcriptional regulatory protein PdtaR [Clostridium aceticum]KJF25862.1 Fis family transcriptional regulator [Clostridium aceticum]
MGKPLRILVAEDEYLCLMGLKSNIEELGHQVVAEATDGMKAVELAIEKKPDLVIMDINMPILDGIEAIKKMNEVLFIPSIIVSGYHDENLIKRATKEGVLYYLIKPIDIRDIKVAINITLARFEEFTKLQDELKDTKKALEARKYIERAKGILMDRMDLKEPEAMKRLQKMSRDHNKKLVEVAKEVIEADKLFEFE